MRQRSGRPAASAAHGVPAR